MLLEAATAAIPAGLLAQLQQAGALFQRARTQGRVGVERMASRGGRPAGTLSGDPRLGGRLNIIETLRAAAPWQTLRRREVAARGGDFAPSRRIEVRRADFRITRTKQKSETATIFVVDASGSSALNRLAEAKGAVELLLADCYVRRDQVAVLAFRGTKAELLLPPSRSLVRAKRCLAGLPGGGPTPLATAIDAAAALADSVRRKGLTPTLIFLTDGRANIARDGRPGREAAQEDAYGAARALQALRLAALLIDTSPKPQPQAERLSAEMAALYLPLPYADASRLSKAVRAVLSEGS
jgi:magnesium chelatase subunit D